jgi:hypothetical protein
MGKVQRPVLVFPKMQAAGDAKSPKSGPAERICHKIRVELTA